MCESLAVDVPLTNPLHAGPTANIPIHDAVCLSRTYHGCCEGDSNPPIFIERLAKMVKDGHFPIDKISRVYKLPAGGDAQEAQKVFEEAVHAMHTGEVIKPIIQFS